jgi:hypothetical protein
VIDLDRQEVQARRDGRPEPPQRVPEASPPLLGDWFIYLSIVVLICGVVVITALNFGAELRSLIVRVPAVIGFGLLVVISADAALRAWRSAWAWLPVDRPRGLSRFIWAAVLGAIFVASIGAASLAILG